MLCNNHPAISYVAWYGLVIMVKEKRIETKDDGSTTEVEVETPYIISDGKSCMKYLYWDKTNPYVLKEDNVWVEESSSQKMIYINENGTATEVPHSDISLYYNDTGNGASAKLTGEALGKFDELNGKYMIVKEDVDGIKEVLGTEGTEQGGTLIDRLNKVEKTAEKTTEEISTVRKDFANSKELETLRNNLNIAMIDLGENLSYYRDSWGEMSKDLEVSSDERRDINQKQVDLLNAYTTLGTYHSTLIERLESSEEDNSNTISNLNISFQALKTSIDNLNNTVTTAISDNTIVPSEITTVLNMMANVALKNNEYKNTVSDSILLGVGGRLTESVLDIRKTSSEFSQTISEVVEEIDGETGLKKLIKDNKTAIEQNANEINLKCVKFNDTTSQLTVGDGFIKLDASKVLMTGTLTWDSLDDEARQNLKGEAGSAEFISLTGEQVIKYDKNNNPNLTTITLNTVISNIDNPTFTWYYKRENQTTWTTMKNTAQSIQITHNDSAIWGGTNSVTIKVAVRDDLYDQMTIIKLYDGIKGDTAKYVTLEGEQLFKYTNNFTSTPSPTSITLTGKRYGISSTNTKWYYKTTGSWTQITNANGSDTLTITPNDYFGSSRVVTIKYEVDTYSDQITIAKVSDGATGNAGKDAYYVYLTNEAHVVSCDEDGNYTSEELNKATTYIKAYKGTTARTDFSVTKTDNGCVSSFDSNNKLLKITSLTSKTATVSLNITIDGLTFNKTMSIAKSIKGDIGTGLNVLGELDNVSQLPSTANPGDAYIINDLLYVWKENVKKWSDGMPFRGEQGVPGEKGEDGRTTYTHIKYSNDGKTFTSNNGEDVGDWMGIYTDFTEADSTTFSHYKWKKIKGADGDNGIVANLSNDSHSVPTDANGNNGNFSGCSTKITLSYNGVVISSGVTYNYSKSNSISGTYDNSTGTYTVSGLSDNTGYIDLKATYNGVTYTKRFTVTKNKSGANGNDAYTINLSNENHSFVANQDGRIETQQSTTTVITAYRGTTAVTPTIGNLPSVGGLSLSKNGTTITITAPVGTNLANQGSFNIPVTVDGKTFNQAFSYTKVKAGKNGYTVILTNESHTFPCENNGNIPSAISTTTVVKAYKGTSEVTPTIGNLPSVSGLALSKSGATITIKANAGTSLSASGKFDIPITVDGVNFTKSFSWAKAYKGNTGSPGSPANIPSWITEWDNGKTTINGSTVLAPKIFAGTVSNGRPTGVALGKNVFGTSGTYANVNGMVGYKSGTKIYEFNSNGNILWGNTNGKYLSWDGTNLIVNASNINLGGSSVATETGVVDKINGIKIGGTNLVANSAPQSTSNWSPSTGWAVSLVNCATAPYGKAIRVTNNSATNGGCHKAPIDHTKLINDEYYTISAWIRASKSCKIDFHNEYMVNTNRINLTTSWKYYTFTSKINTGKQYHSDVFYVSTDTISTGMWLEVHSLKLEKGTKPSSWSPAPEDINSSIASVDGKFANYSTTNQMNSAITQKANEITSSVSRTYATKTDLKATDDKFANYSTTSQMNSAINQKADGILSTVSNNYTTKGEFNNLNISTRNLLLNTANSVTLVGNGTENQSVTAYRISDPTLLAGKTATLSFKYTLSNWNGQGGIKPQTASSTWNAFSQVWFWANGTFEYESTITFSGSNADTELQIRADWLGGTVTILPNTCILTLSDRKVGWMPAPEDIDSRITAVDNKFVNYSTTSQMNSAIKQKAESITQSVSSTYATKTSLKSANDNITSLTNRMQSAESKLTKDSLTTTIGKYYTTSTDVNGIISNKGYATTSQLQQTATDLTATFNNGYTRGITQMNADGVKVYHNQISGENYTHMSPAGFYVKYKGKDILICDSNGLSYEGTITGSTIKGSIFKSGADYNPHKQNITGLQMQDDTIYSYGTKNNGMYAVTKISGGTINIGNGEDGAGLNWSVHINSSDISLFKQGSTGYFYVGSTEAPGSGYSTTTTTIDTTTINIGSKDVTTAFKVDYNDNCEFGNNYFTRGSLTINQLSKGVAKGTQTYLTGTTISATNIYQNGSNVSGSDIILKDNIKEYEDSALDIINKTKVYSFNRILANQDKTEIGFLAQQVPDIFVFDKGEFTAEELEGLTAQEKQQLLDKKTKEHRTVLENKKLDEIADKVTSFYDLNNEQTEEQISQIIDEYKNIEYEVPISTINQNNIIAIMFKAIQELKAELDEVKKSL